MNKQFLVISRHLLNQLLIASVSSLFIVNTALAYNPPKKPSRPRTTTSNAIRNDLCLQSTEYNLTVLAPVGHIGETISQQPIFAWFLPNSKPRKMELSVFEYVNDARGKKIKSFQLDSQPGRMMKFSPNSEGFTFELGKTYLWQISLLCDRNNPMKDIFAEAVIQIVPKSPALVSQLGQANDPLKRAKIYADAGLWYDAFAEVLENPQGKDFMLQMLTKLSKLEAESAGDASEKWLKDNLEAQASQLEKVVAREK
ncbi:DUF928 domain-containing protein [Scytonema hofmannii]|nr:DUF928 domain-containing protein [Scytonema hofmannii]